MKSYIKLLNYVLGLGTVTKNRTGVDTLSVFGYQWRHDMATGFPLLTTKKMQVKSIATELIWFLRGDTNISFLHENDVHIWDAWADKYGEVGPSYGKQWRRWFGLQRNLDQIDQLIYQLMTDLDSRRMIVMAWNPMDIHRMALPPCHFAFQCRVVHGKLSLHFFMRSADAFLGLPFDIASYAFLQCLLCHQTGLALGELVCSITDLHIYANHMKQVETQVTRVPIQLPQFILQKEVKSINDYTVDDLVSSIRGYVYQPAIPAPVAV